MFTEETDEIRSEVCRKLLNVSVSGYFFAMLGHLLGERWTIPIIEELVFKGKDLLCRVEGNVNFKVLGARSDLYADVKGVSKTAGLSPAESRFLFNKVLELEPKYTLN